MTGIYDDMRVAPDPAQAEELRQRLHARIARVSSDGERGRSEGDADAVHDRAAWLIPMREIPAPGPSTSRDRARRRRLLAAAAAIVAIGAGVAVGIWRSGDADPSVDVTDTPTTTPTPTDAPPPTIAGAPLVGEAIRVTPDSVEFGDRLVGGNSVRAAGRTYVKAGLYRDPVELSLTDPAQALVAAFDDAGVELWRTELDGTPSDVFLVDDELWVTRRDAETVRIDATDGRILGDAPFSGPPLQAFGWWWQQIGDVADPAAGPSQLIRIDPTDLSTTAVDLPVGLASGTSPRYVSAGAGAMWVPLKEGGVAVIDPETLDLAVIPADDIGHWVTQVAFDGDVAYLASDWEVTSMVDGEVRATVDLTGAIDYLGPIDGTFGALLSGGPFYELRADDPMVVAERRFPTSPQGDGVNVVDGEAWLDTAPNFSRRRVHFLSDSAEDGA